MAMDLRRPDLLVAVFGAGTMGRGIAQVCAQAGLTTLLFDARDGAVTEALAAIDKGLEGQVAKGRMTRGRQSRRHARAYKPIDSLDEAASAGRGDRSDRRKSRGQARAVSRAGKASGGRRGARHQHVVAVGDRNRRRLRQAGARRRPAFLQSAAADAAGRGDRRPAHRSDAGRRAGRLCHAGSTSMPWSRPTRRASSSITPAAPMGRKRCASSSQGIASPREVDLLMKEAAGFRMGPFELLDLVGGDVTHAVMVSIYDQYFGEPMYQPSAQMAVRVAGGLARPQDEAGLLRLLRRAGGSAPTVTRRRAADADVGLGRGRRWRQRACRSC